MNTEVHHVGGIDVEVVRKKIKNLHVGCYPPEGRVRIAAPESMSREAIRIAILTRMPWIRRKQIQFQRQERQSPRRYVSGETHFLFGRGLKLDVQERRARSHQISRLGCDRLILSVPRQSSVDQRRRWMEAWLRSELRKLAEPKISSWSERIGVRAQKWGIRRMKTKWGSCNVEKGLIWISLDLARKPDRLIDYVIVHELAHLVSRRHDERFTKILDQEMPRWRRVRQELNALPLQAWED